MQNAIDHRTPTNLLALGALFTLILQLGMAVSSVAQERKAPTGHVKDVEVAEFARLTADTNNIVLDVRTPREYASGHLAGAMNLNLRAADFVTQAGKLDKGRTYLVYCAVGARSTSACQKLGSLGFPSLVNLKNGLQSWEGAGQPVQR